MCLIFVWQSDVLWFLLLLNLLESRKVPCLPEIFQLWAIGGRLFGCDRRTNMRYDRSVPSLKGCATFARWAHVCSPIKRSTHIAGSRSRRDFPARLIAGHRRCSCGRKAQVSVRTEGFQAKSTASPVNSAKPNLGALFQKARKTNGSLTVDLRFFGHPSGGTLDGAFFGRQASRWDFGW